MSFKTYNEYIDSEVDWIGLLPSSWQTLKSKFIFNRINIQSTTGSEELLSVSEYYGVKPKKETIDDGDFLSRAESLIGYKKCSKNDLVMNIMLAWKKGLGVTEHEGIVSPAYEIFTINTHVAYPRYMNYLLRTELYTSEFKRHSYGVIDSRLRLYPDNFKEVECILPSVEEQQQIANYLDKKTAKIDATIAKNEELIELLEEKRVALINQVVTKGLNPDVPMKDSGVEWIGEIPEHWEITKVKHELDFLDHKRVPLSAEDRSDMDRIYDYYGASGVIDKVDSYLFDGKYILVGEDGANLLLRSTPLAFIAEGKFWVNNHAHILSPNDGNNIDYFVSLLEAVDYTPFIEGSAQPKLTANNLKNIIVVKPPLSEQNEIAIYLTNILNHIDKTLEKIQKNITLLEEYKTSLIHHVVTGKIDVRGEEI